MAAIVAIVILAIDQITKAFFSSRDFLVKNYGLPFGINFDPKVNLLIVVACFITFTGYLLYKRKDRRLILGTTIVLAGAFSNIADRVVLGYVRDFINFGLGFTFNLADVFIIIGIIMLLYNSQKHFHHGRLT